MALASTTEIRSHFPALQRSHGNVPVAYFDGPGGTQVPSPVPIAMADYLFHRNANAHWAFPTSSETDRVRHQAREAMADLLGAEAGEIVLYRLDESGKTRAASGRVEVFGKVRSSETDFHEVRGRIGQNVITGDDCR